MTPKQKIKASKFLCRVLRHKPVVIGITLDENGWAVTSEVLRGLKEHFADMSLGVLKEIVAEDDKQRYSFSDQTGHKIRANQGHSLDVDLQLVQVEPPELLYHGTAKQTLWLIRRDGLLPMDRQHVHLSVDTDTAKKVGSRHGEPSVITVRSGEMAKTGLPFYRSNNGIWLAERVPVDYLDVEDFRDE